MLTLNPSVLFTILPLFLSSTSATPVSSISSIIADPSQIPASTVSTIIPQPSATTLPPTPSGPKINVIFFSDNNCTTTVPLTIYTRDVFGDHGCYSYPTELYQSLLIDHIDDQFIGTNSALQVGNRNASKAGTCGGGESACDDFGTALKYSVATKETLNQCQFIGIPSGQGKPLVGGNEYRLTSLQG